VICRHFHSPVEPLRLDALSRDRDPEIEGRGESPERRERRVRSTAGFDPVESRRAEERARSPRDRILRESCGQPDRADAIAEAEHFSVVSLDLD
jgi:hypothetical protein